MLLLLYLDNMGTRRDNLISHLNKSDRNFTLCRTGILEIKFLKTVSLHALSSCLCHSKISKPLPEIRLTFAATANKLLWLLSFKFIHLLKFARGISVAPRLYISAIEQAGKH